MTVCRRLPPLLAALLAAGAALAADVRFASVTPGAKPGEWDVVVAAKSAPAFRVDGAAVTPAAVEPAGKGLLRVRLTAPAGAVRLEAGRATSKGFDVAAAVALGPATAASAPFADWTIYHVYLATFRNGDPANDGVVKGWRDPKYAGGDLRGVLQSLDHIKAAGANAIWISPMFQALTSHGYDVTNYFELGDGVGVPGDPKASRALWDELVREARARGIRLILDVPLNHASRSYAATGDPKGFRPKFGGPVQEAERVWESWGGNYRYWRHDDPATRAFLVDVANYWLANGADGLRLDYVRGVPRDFWAEMYAAVKKDHPGAFLFGEAWSDADGAEKNAKDIATYWARAAAAKGAPASRQFDALLDFPLQIAMTDVFARGGDATILEDTLQLEDALYGPGAAPAFFLDNHDLARFMDIAGDRRRLVAAATFMASLTGSPILFYGTETGISGGQPKAGFNDSGRVPMPWDRLDAGLVATFGTIFRTRREHPALTRGARWPLFADKGALVMAKSAGDETILVATNAGGAPRDLDVAFPGAGATVLLGDAKAARDPQTGALRLSLPALSTSWIVPR